MLLMQSGAAEIEGSKGQLAEQNTTAVSLQTEVDRLHLGLSSSNGGGSQSHQRLGTAAEVSSNAVQVCNTTVLILPE